MIGGGDTHTVIVPPASGATAEQRLRNSIKDILGAEAIKNYRKLNISGPPATPLRWLWLKLCRLPDC